MKNRERIISNYIAAYNKFDIDGMSKDMDEGIVFQNISNGETTMSLTGLEAFKEQAGKAKYYFSSRTQKIISFKHEDDETEIEIDYNAVLAMDFPNGLKEGDELKLKGRSTFKFNGDKVIRLTDFS